MVNKVTKRTSPVLDFFAQVGFTIIIALIACLMSLATMFSRFLRRNEDLHLSGRNFPDSESFTSPQVKRGR